MDMELFRVFTQRVLGKSLDSTEPVWLSGWEVVEALWPLNERFRQNIHQIRALPYDKAFEVEADVAIEAFVLHQAGADWATVSAGAWRVLLERLQQGMVVALANEAAGNPLMAVPSGLPKAARTAVAMILLLHQMTLPFPVEDRSGFVLPAGALPASLRQH